MSVCNLSDVGARISLEMGLFAWLQKYSFQVKRCLTDEASTSDSTAHLENMVSGFVSTHLMSPLLSLQMYI